MAYVHKSYMDRKVFDIDNMAAFIKTIMISHRFEASMMCKAYELFDTDFLDFHLYHWFNYRLVTTKPDYDGDYVMPLDILDDDWERGLFKERARAYNAPQTPDFWDWIEHTAREGKAPDPDMVSTMHATCLNICPEDYDYNKEYT